MNAEVKAAMERAVAGKKQTGDSFVLANYAIRLAPVAEQMVEALREEVRQLQERQQGATHWAGCESAHRACAAIARMEAALAAYAELKGGQHGE